MACLISVAPVSAQDVMSPAQMKELAKQQKIAEKQQKQMEKQQKEAEKQRKKAEKERKKAEKRQKAIDKANVAIYAADGKLLISRQAVGGQTTVLPMTAFPAGNYIINAGGASFKFVKQ